MVTLVKSLQLPEGGDFFDDYDVLDDVKIKYLPPREVLERLLPAFYLKEYQGVSPWLVKRKVGLGVYNHGWIDILTIDSNRHDMTIEELMTLDSFKSARRPHPLTEDEKESLAHDILIHLTPENTNRYFLSRERNAALVYSDVLQFLGKDISEEKIEAIFSEQYERLHNQIRQGEMKRAQDWAELANQVIGCEVLDR
ncbi:hypothetical protein COU57_06925 [Candidatus Pacearchaeota archaeon CG10_big_fil_rev_8_21_14_0_10_32_14]|nr:MAG: hypothetical protein COU57_06925 [Candidatus Pacearchaeota archaeon CG10_big_fil_rev_8_21_14_0_10_32_14]